MAECVAAHTDCEAVLCRESGGTWLFWAEECGHYFCGSPPPATCEMGFAVCDCGDRARWMVGEGCIPTDCPPDIPRTREERCTMTGGSWEPICCDSVCGQACPDPCLADACRCGPFEVFDEVRGCVESAECHERDEGETCEAGVSRCATGTICCEHLGGIGTIRPDTCEVPICDDNPDIDECGNNLLVP
jgi:hypothetical protein